MTGSLLQPLGDKAIVGVDVDLAQRTSAGVDELVRDAGWSNEDLAAGYVDRILADGEGSAPPAPERLRVRVPMQLRAAPGGPSNKMTHTGASPYR